MKPAETTIVFDGDQTLWDFQSAMIRALGETRIEMARVTGLPIDHIPSIGEMVTIRHDVGARARSTDTLEAIRRAAFAATLTKIGQVPSDQSVLRITEFFMGRRYEMCRPYLDTVPTLMALGEHYQIALLTNGNSHPDRIGLRDLFDHIVIADEVLARKPDPAVYAHVAARCGGRTFVSVGDSPVNDIVGPQRAGWKAIWVNRARADLPDEVRPDAVLADLGGLEVAIRDVCG